jgi:putative selenate reductase
MHGCPPEEIESIAVYLMKEKGLNTLLKLNPTLIGFEEAERMIEKYGYRIGLKKESFSEDLQMDDALELISKLNDEAAECGRFFGLKMSNTLPVINSSRVLPGEEVYLSGKIMFPITMKVTEKLVDDLGTNITISYCGGANFYNTFELLEAGLSPVTYATELLKPGGYYRLFQIADRFNHYDFNIPAEIDKKKLDRLQNSIGNKHYSASYREVQSIRINKPLEIFDCYAAPCVTACPINQDVPEYIQLLREKRFLEAFKLIVSKNPLPHITGYICDHQCMFNCSRWDYEKPVLIRDLKKYAAEKGFESYKESFVNKVKPNNKKAAIIGAGPAGLSAAFFLSRSGFEVSIFEKENSAGGIVKNYIPRFRIPEEIIQKDIELLALHGVSFIFNCDYDFSIQELKSSGFDYIIIAIGAGISRKLSIDTDKEIIGALDLLWDFKNNNRLSLGKNVAVIGGGNSAMDGARAAKRFAGVQNVELIYRRTREFMPADKEEFDAAIEDGVRFHELLNPVSFKEGKLRCQKMELGNFDEEGRRIPIPVGGSFLEFEIDSVVSAIGETVDYDLLKTNGISLFDNSGSAADSNSPHTNMSNVYIIGDALKGPATVVEAISDAEKCAKSILNETGIEDLHKSSYRPALNNIKNSIIASRKLSLPDENNPEEECDRCLMCNYECNKCVEVCPNRANIPIRVSSSLFSDVFQIVNINKFCNDCGNCDTFCPYSGSPHKSKLNIFDDLEGFNSTGRNALLLKENGKEGNILIKRNGKIISETKLSEDSEEDIRIKELLKAIKENYRFIFE